MYQPWPTREITGAARQLSTRTRLFSTQPVDSLQLRDVEFVTIGLAVTYRRTGADSRVRVACAPAFPKHVPQALRP